MEWTREKTIALISEYRKRHGLWDMTDDDYRKKEVKHQLLKSVSESLGGDISIHEIEKKFHTLRTQYHREINRMKRKEPYNSKWFGFKYLQFLSSPKACRSTKGRIKAEITEDGTVTTKFIIRDPLSGIETSAGASGIGGSGSAHDNEEFVTLQKVENCSTGLNRTHELEKLIEETTKDVDDMEDSKTKMENDQDDQDTDQHHSEYNSGELQIGSVNTEPEDHHMEEIDDNIEELNMQNAEVEDITYPGTSSATTSSVLENQQSSASVHTIPARIIKIQRRNVSQENDYYSDNNSQQQRSHQTLHTIPSNGAPPAKRIFFDANNGQYTTTIATSTPHNHLTLRKTATPSTSASSRQPLPSTIPPSSKIHIRNNMSSLVASSKNKPFAISNTSTVSNTSIRDECSTYGEYVGNEMRNIRKREILVSLKHKINTALFEASMDDLQK